MSAKSNLSVNPKVVSLLRGKARPADATVELVEALKTQVTEALRDRLNVMFDGADDLLFEFAERASNNNDRRLFFDTMRAVRLGRKNMLIQFCDAYAASFVAVPSSKSSSDAARSDEDDLSLQKTEAVELAIAVSNMATKAEGLYRQTLWEIGGRVKSLVEELNAPMSSEALTPATICKAFRDAAESLKIEFAVELVIFKLFDRLVISELAELYQRILHFLKQSGVRAAASGAIPGSRPGSTPGSTPGSIGESTASAQAAAESGIQSRMAEGSGRALPPSFGGPSFGGQSSPGNSFQSFGNAPLSGNLAPDAAEWRAPVGLAASMMMSPSLDPQTLASLQRIGAASPNVSSYNNASLAADLAAAAQGQVVVGWTPRQTTAYVQRASLVGHMFNDILGDQQLPNTLRTQFDGLRMSTVKVALKDIAFISDPDHPVRKLINELATMASTARAGGAEHMSRIAELVSQIQKQFDIAAESLRKPPPEIELVAPDQAEHFIEQQMAQTASRRQSIVKKVRRIIAEELQLRTVGTVISDELRPLLNSCWAPMMAMHLLHHGPDSVQWKRGAAQLDRIIEMLNPVRDDLRNEPTVRGLRAELETELKTVGLTAGRVTEALDGFERTLNAIKSGAPASDPVLSNLSPPANLHAQTTSGAAEGASELLEQLLQPGAWFLIFDVDRNESRWMKAVAYYAGLDCAAFAEFSGSNTLLLKSRMLMDDLLARRTVPIDLGPTARATLDRFLARAA